MRYNPVGPPPGVPETRRLRKSPGDDSMSTVDIKNAEHYKWGNACDGWHLLQSDSLSVIEERVPPGEGEQRHIHNNAQQFFYVLCGEANIEVAGNVHLLRQGQGLHVPPGVPHQLSNMTHEPLRFLVVSEPESHGDRVQV